MQAQGREPGGMVGHLVSNFAAVGAVVVGTLYLSGLLLKWSELRHAGVSVHDVLPLFPLEQILGTGLTLVAPALAGILVMALVLGALHAYELRGAVLARRFRDMHAPRVPEDERTWWLEDLDAAIADLDWDRIEPRMRAALDQAKEAGDAARVKKLKRMRRWLRAFYPLMVAFGGALGIAYSVIFPPAIAIPGFIVSPIVVLIAALALPLTGPAYRVLVLYYVVFVILLVVATLSYPRELPATRVVTDNEGVVDGRLVFRGDATWYVTVGDGVIRTLHNDHVECARVEPSPPRRRPLIDLRPPEPRRPLGELRCPKKDEEPGG